MIFDKNKVIDVECYKLWIPQTNNMSHVHAEYNLGISLSQK